MSKSSGRPVEPPKFLKKVEFRDAAHLSYATSAIVVPAYDAIKRDFGIIRAEYLLLLCLAHYPELTAQDVSRLTGRPRNSISRAVHRMLSVGYLDRVPDPDDGRQAVLTITAEGRALHEKIVTYLLDREAEVLKVLDPSERKELRRILHKVANYVAAL